MNKLSDKLQTAALIIVILAGWIVGSILVFPLVILGYEK